MPPNKIPAINAYTHLQPEFCLNLFFLCAAGAIPLRCAFGSVRAADAFDAALLCANDIARRCTDNRQNDHNDDDIRHSISPLSWLMP